jgi:hypothetical protein
LDVLLFFSVLDAELCNFIFQSVCKTSLDTVYTAVHLLLLGGLYFDISNVSVSELLAVPQSGIPYVQMGFRIVL